MRYLIVVIYLGCLSCNRSSSDKRSMSISTADVQRKRAEESSDAALPNEGPPAKEEDESSCIAKGGLWRDQQCLHGISKIFPSPETDCCSA